MNTQTVGTSTAVILHGLMKASEIRTGFTLNGIKVRVGVMPHSDNEILMVPRADLEQLLSLLTAHQFRFQTGERK